MPLRRSRRGRVDLDKQPCREAIRGLSWHLIDRVPAAPITIGFEIEVGIIGVQAIALLVDQRCLVAGRWAGVGESSGVNVGRDTTSERGESAAIHRHGGRVELESLG